MQDRMCYMQIPRPILRMDHFASSLKSGGSLNGRYYPDESTVVVVHSARTSVGNRRARCSCSSWQLSFSVCSFILLALVAMIVYMEGIAWLLSNAKIQIAF